MGRLARDIFFNIWRGRRPARYEHSLSSLILPEGYVFTRTGTASTFGGGASYAERTLLGFDTDEPAFAWAASGYGLAMQGARTNVETNSSGLNNAAWSKNGVTISSDQATGPDGTLADKIIPSVTAGVEHSIHQGISFAPSGVSGSILAKAAGYNYVSVISITPDGNDRYGGVISLIDGTVASASTAAGSTPTGTSTFVESLPDGWYRICVSQDSTVTGTHYLIVAASPTGSPTKDTNGNPLYAGDGTSGVLVCGFQMESGKPASSLIGTTAASATRNADRCIRTGVTLSSDGESGVFVGVAPVAFGGTHTFYRRDDNTDAEYYRLGINSSGHGILDVVTASGSVASLDVGAIAAGSKFAAAWRLVANDFAAVQAGGSVATDGTGAIPVAPSYERLGHGRTGNECYGLILKCPVSATKRRKPLSNSALQALAARAYAEVAVPTNPLA